MIGKFGSVGTVDKECTEEIDTEVTTLTDQPLRFNQVTEEPVIQWEEVIHLKPEAVIHLKPEAAILRRSVVTLRLEAIQVPKVIQEALEEDTLINFRLVAMKVIISDRSEFGLGFEDHLSNDLPRHLLYLCANVNAPNQEILFADLLTTSKFKIFFLFPLIQNCLMLLNIFRSHSPAPYSPVGPERDNCELSDKDSRELDVNNPTYFEISGDYDYFERSPGRQGQGDCLDG